MEVTEIVEKYIEDNDCDIPDNIIYIIFPEDTQQILPVNPTELSNICQFNVSTDVKSLDNQGILSTDRLFSCHTNENSPVKLKRNIEDSFELNDLNCSVEEAQKIDAVTQTDFSHASDKIANTVKYVESQNPVFLSSSTSSSETEDNVLKNGECDERGVKIDVSFPSFNSDNKSFPSPLETTNTHAQETTATGAKKIESLRMFPATNTQAQETTATGAKKIESLRMFPATNTQAQETSATGAKKMESLRTFPEKQKLKKEKRNHSSMNLKCQHCTKEFSTFCSLQKHSKTVHNSDEFSFPCNLCNQSFTRPHNLLRHKETRHAEGEKKYVCEYCGRKFGRQDIYASHVRLIHFKHKNDFNTSDPIFQCSSCKKFFTKLHNFKKHQKGNLTCSKCSETFACKRSLRNHLNKKHSVTCVICGKICSSKQQMYAHKLTHTPKFKCEYCGKGFVWESQFTVHLATHTGIRPLSCDICGNSFAHPNAVKKHKWQDHTEANKKHRCSVCGKGFVYRSKLNAHVRIHTGKKPFPCQRCSSYFSQKRNLAAHMKVVHGLIFKYLEEDDDEEDEKVCDVKSVPESESNIKEYKNEQLREEGILPSKEKQSLNISPDEMIIDEAEPIYQILYTYPNEESSISFPSSVTL